MSLITGSGVRTAGDDVLTLGVDQKLAVKLVDPVGWISCESDAGTGRLTRIAEHHRLHVDGRAPFGGDVVFRAVDLRSVVHPGTEDGTGCAFELFPWIVGKLLARAILDQRLEPVDQLVLIFGGELRVDDVVVIFLVLEFMDDRLEGLIIFTLALLHAEHHVAVHLDESAITIPGKTFVVGRLGK